MNKNNSQRRALITGISGQDGAYLAKLLLENGYDVYGGLRRSASRNLWRLEDLGLIDRIKFVDFELSEFSNIFNAINDIKPNEVYNLASNSDVAIGHKQPLYTGEVDALGVTRILEAIRIIDSSIRFYQASSSEMFGNAEIAPQTEISPFNPRSPYGITKLYAHWTTVNYREAYNLYATSGILYNHESPLRGTEFVTRKVTSGLAKIRCGLEDCIFLGNLDSERDWGHAADYMRGIWQILQLDEPEDFILATGKLHGIRDLVILAAGAAGFDIEWTGEGIEETAIERKSGNPIVKVDPKLYRPIEAKQLVGDASKAEEKLGWRPEISFEQMIVEMVKYNADQITQYGKIF